MKSLKPPSPKQLKNEKTLKIYAGFLCCLIFVTVAARWLQRDCSRKTISPKEAQRLRGTLRRLYLNIFSKLRRRLTSKWLGRPSSGILLISGIFLTGNAILSSNILASHQLNHWASRLGWLGAANMALCVFFGLKNTPLPKMASVAPSYLNILHRIVGYASVFLVIFHALLYTIYFGRQGRWVTLIEMDNIAGIISGIMMLILLMGIFRHRGYETFYLSHILGFVAAVILTALHRPIWAKKLPLVMLYVGCIWLFDCFIRVARMSYNMINNSVTLYPLPDGGTRLVLRKSPLGTAVPGSYCYLWIPRIRIFQTHPFTIVDNGPSGLELVMKSHRGFTKAVHSFANGAPHRSAWASIDGPYGSLPDMEAYDKLVFIAGGSGAAFTFGLTNHILQRHGRATPQTIEFIWAVKRREHISWFYDHLKNFTSVVQSFNIRIYITDEQLMESSNYPDRAVLEDEGTEYELETTLLSKLPVISYETIPELEATRMLLDDSAGRLSDLGQCFKFRKLEVERIIHKMIRTTDSQKRVLIATCGPKTLMDAVADATDRRCLTRPDLRIDVHTEDFN